MAAMHSEKQTFNISELKLSFLLQRRRRIDRSMIGQPTNFVHTGHIGSGDVSNQNGDNKVSIRLGWVKWW